MYGNIEIPEALTKRGTNLSKDQAVTTATGNLKEDNSIWSLMWEQATDMTEILLKAGTYLSLKDQAVTTATGNFKEDKNIWSLMWEQATKIWQRF